MEEKFSMQDVQSGGEEWNSKRNESFGVKYLLTVTASVMAVIGALILTIVEVIIIMVLCI